MESLKRILLFDLDGTMLRDDKTFPDPLWKLFPNARNGGVSLAFRRPIGRNGRNRN